MFVVNVLDWFKWKDQVKFTKDNLFFCVNNLAAKFRSNPMNVITQAINDK